ncbi:MAG: hypothetical protein NTY48_05340 [Candidatus Diapherotrites archaeon]|nr:hypothetical protein [Candidatus Diapherotrites archaeon]
MADCFFCGAFVGENNGDGGTKGRSIGNRDICEQCLSELKYWLESAVAKSPSTRGETEEGSGSGSSTDVKESTSSDDPFSSKATI